MGKGGGSFFWGNVTTQKSVCSQGFLAQILILIQTTFGNLVKQIHDRSQVIKVEVISQSYLWDLSVSTRDPLIKQIVIRNRQLTKAVL